MLSEKLGHRLDSPLSQLIKRGPLSKLSPTALTLTGLLVNLIAAGFIIPGCVENSRHSHSCCRTVRHA